MDYYHQVIEAAEWLLNHGHDQEGLEWTTQILRDQAGHAPTLELLADYYQRKGETGRANYYQHLLNQAAMPEPPKPSSPPRS